MGFKSDWGSQMKGVEETKNLKIDFGKLKHIVKNNGFVLSGRRAHKKNKNRKEKQ